MCLLFPHYHLKTGGQISQLAAAKWKDNSSVQDIHTGATHSKELTIDEKKKKIINKEKAVSELEKIKDAIYVSGILAQVVSTYGDHMQSAVSTWIDCDTKKITATKV